LVVGGVGHHIFTYNAIPWVEEDILRHEITPDRSYKISVANHQWRLPPKPMVAKLGERVEFDVRSDDLTYGLDYLGKDGNQMVYWQDAGFAQK